MLFKELLTTSWSDVKESLLAHYPSYSNSMSGFENAFKELRALPPGTDISSLVICIDQIEDRYDVLGYEEGEKLGIEYSSWDKWLNYLIRECDLQEMSKADYVAHCLWELTWNGFSKQKCDKAIENLKIHDEDSTKEDFLNELEAVQEEMWNERKE